MAFWTDAAAEDPKRKFNFIVEISATPGTRPQSYHVKTASLPKFNVNKVEAKYFNHTFKYPGSITWDPVSLTFIDSSQDDSASTSFMKLLEGMGYYVPSSGLDQSSISKRKAVSSLGTVKLKQLDSDGNTINTWTLRNAFITSVTFGDLAYGEDELVEVQVEIDYDFAEYDS